MIKRIALIAFSASVLFVGCGSEVIENYYPNSDKMKEQIHKKANKEGVQVKHGLHSKWSRMGYLVSVESFKEGLLDSIATYYYTKDKKEHELTYVGGKKHGVETWWYSGGNTKSEVTWQNGKKVGTETKWSSGNVKNYEAIYVDGLKDGIESEWFEDGELKSQTGWAAGNKEGKDTQWCFEAGIKSKHYKGHERFWKEGKQHKTEKWWSCDFNGNISSKMYYKKGQLHGKYVAYWVAGSHKGRVMESATYKNGDEKLATKKRYFNPEDEKKRPRSTPIIGLTKKEKKMLKLMKKMERLKKQEEAEKKALAIEEAELAKEEAQSASDIGQ